MSCNRKHKANADDTSGKLHTNKEGRRMSLEKERRSMQESKRRGDGEEKQKYTSEGDHEQELQTDGATREMRHNTENNFGHPEKILNSSEKK